MFTIISTEEANEILEKQGIVLDWEQDLGWDDDSDGTVYLAEEDVHLQNFTIGELHDDAALYIFKKNLIIDEWMVSYDLDYSPALVVLGDFKADVCNLSGNGYYFLGSMNMTKMLGGKYNHGYLVAKGPVKTPLIFTDDFQMNFYHEDFDVDELVGYEIYHSNKLQPPTQNSWGIFQPELVYQENCLEGHCMLEDGALVNRIIKNKEFLKEVIPYSFDSQGFLDAFQRNDKLVEEKYFTLEKYGVEYNFGKLHTSVDGKRRHILYIQYYKGYSFVMVYCLDDQSFQGIFNQSTKDNETITLNQIPCNLEQPKSIADKALLRGIRNALDFLAK